MSVRRTERRREVEEEEQVEGGEEEAVEPNSPFPFPLAGGASPAEVDASALKTYELAVGGQVGVEREWNEEQHRRGVSLRVVPHREKREEGDRPAVKA